MNNILPVSYTHLDVYKRQDWNQTAPIDTKPTLEDFKKTVSDYLAWEVSNLLKNQSLEDDLSLIHI